MELPKEFDDRHWWIVVTIAGGIITAASAPVKFVPGFLIGLAVLCFGVGQWIDHPIQTGMRHGIQFTAYYWRPSFAGVATCVIGLVLFLIGIAKLLAE